MFLNFQKNRLKPDAKPTLFDIPNPPAKVGSKRRKLQRTDTPPTRHGITSALFLELINALQVLKIFIVTKFTFHSGKKFKSNDNPACNSATCTTVEGL